MGAVSLAPIDDYGHPFYGQRRRLRYASVANDFNPKVPRIYSGSSLFVSLSVLMVWLSGSVPPPPPQVSRPHYGSLCCRCCCYCCDSCYVCCSRCVVAVFAYLRRPLKDCKDVVFLSRNGWVLVLGLIIQMIPVFKVPCVEWVLDLGNPRCLHILPSQCVKVNVREPL